jgi:ribulose 1,5-bisphosphate synthetase/thiazole synthase
MPQDLASSLLPVDNPTESFWLSEPHELHNYRSTENVPVSCDVAIIGAGYAGVSTAYNLVKGEAAQTSPRLSVTIIEARGACSGATGRNGKHLT